MEFKFVRYFLFMGLNPKTYNFDKKVSNIYVLLKSIEVYETYLSTAEIDENYEKNFESEYEKMAKEKDGFLLKLKSKKVFGVPFCLQNSIKK